MYFVCLLQTCFPVPPFSKNKWRENITSQKEAEHHPEKGGWESNTTQEGDRRRPPLDFALPKMNVNLRSLMTVAHFKLHFILKRNGSTTHGRRKKKHRQKGGGIMQHYPRWESSTTPKKCGKTPPPQQHHHPKGDGRESSTHHMEEGGPPLDPTCKKKDDLEPASCFHFGCILELLMFSLLLHPGTAFVSSGRGDKKKRTTNTKKTERTRREDRPRTRDTTTNNHADFTVLYLTPVQFNLSKSNVL